MHPRGQDFPSKTLCCHALCLMFSLYSLDVGSHSSSYQVPLCTVNDIARGPIRSKRLDNKKRTCLFFGGLTNNRTTYLAFHLLKYTIKGHEGAGCATNNRTITMYMYNRRNNRTIQFCLVFNRINLQKEGETIIRYGNHKHLDSKTAWVHVKTL